MPSSTGYWARQRWGPLAELTEYQRGRVMGLTRRNGTAKPTDDELRLAADFVAWRSGRIWRNALGALVLAGLCLLIPMVPRSFWWLTLWMAAIGVVTELVRVHRWRSALPLQRERTG